MSSPICPELFLLKSWAMSGLQALLLCAEAERRKIHLDLVAFNTAPRCHFLDGTIGATFESGIGCGKNREDTEFGIS